MRYQDGLEQASAALDSPGGTQAAFPRNGIDLLNVSITPDGPITRTCTRSTPRRSGSRSMLVSTSVDGDGVLLERWRAGDQRAGQDLFHRHFAEILRFFDNKAWDKAEDLTQQTFLECVGSRDRFRGDSSFRTYLFAIAWNQLRHHYRQGLKNEHVDFDASSVNELIGSMTSPSSQIDRARRGDQIRQALKCLPMAQQALLECHYWQDLDAAALSEIFGVPPGAIRVRLLRARNALRAELAKLDGTRSLQGEDAQDPLAASLSRLQAEDHREEYP